MTRRRRRLALLPLAILVSGCGPSVPLSLVMRQSSVDVGGGQPPPIVVPAPMPMPAPRPAPPMPIAIGPVALPSLAPVTLGPAPPAPSLPSPVTCPTAGEFAVPALAADPSIAGPPAAATYHFRESGQSSTGAPLNISLPVGSIGLRTVKRGAAGQGYDFSVDEVTGAAETVSAFSVVQPSGGVGAQQGGLYLVSLDWKDAVLGKLSFHPLQPVLFLPLPAQPGQQPFTSAGLDPQSNVAVALKGQVTGKRRVDACGSLIDTWELSLTETIAAAQSELNVTATYDIATQYGGISVQDDVAISGTNTGNALAAAPSEEVKSAIAELPKGAAQ